MQTEQATASNEAARLEHLCDVEWRSRPDAEPIVAPKGRGGAHIGDGDGVVSGPEINGRVRFSFYTADCPYDPGFLEAAGIEFGDIRDHVCRINPRRHRYRRRRLDPVHARRP